MKKIAILLPIIILTMGFTLFNRQTKEERFWNWVIKNKVKLEDFIYSNHEDYTIYNQFTKEIKKYNSLLFVEMTLTENNEVVLILTPDGMPEGVLPIQKLFDSKPVIDNWVIKKFRQPTDEIELNFDGIEYPSSDIVIVPRLDKERDKINIIVFIKNMNLNKKRYQSLAWLYLDHILGEYNTITKVGSIDFRHFDKEQHVNDGISILDLRKSIEKELYKVEN